MSGVFTRLVGQSAAEVELVAAAVAARGDSAHGAVNPCCDDARLADHRAARIGPFGGRALFRRRSAVHVRRRPWMRELPGLHHDDGGYPR